MEHPQKKTMVCVTVQRNCERLIHEGAKLSGDEALHVVHVVRTGGTVLGGGNDSEALDYLFQVSRQFGAEMDMLRSDDVFETIAKFARKNSIGYLVIGAPPMDSPVDVGSLLRGMLPSVKVFVIP